MNPKDYEVSIRPLSSEDGGGYLARVPDLPGCMSDGETPEEALANAYDAIGCWIEAAGEMGRAVPAPRRAAA
ncbi:MAG TPA: type II toxin-antitoxin system HicB family antitoxin [Sphingomonas sp.]|jgi:predicted RNase H-like HicB family nuclease|nr:type II toxin-antitoxin system HicB family antitoxin [Sphingomonas sp.]